MRFPISRDPPEGGTRTLHGSGVVPQKFPISRDPPEGGTPVVSAGSAVVRLFPISRDPPEGGTQTLYDAIQTAQFVVSNF